MNPVKILIPFLLIVSLGAKEPIECLCQRTDLGLFLNSDQYNFFKDGSDEKLKLVMQRIYARFDTVAQYVKSNGGHLHILKEDYISYPQQINYKPSNLPNKHQDISQNNYDFSSDAKRTYSLDGAIFYLYFYPKSASRANWHFRMTTSENIAEKLENPKNKATKEVLNSNLIKESDNQIEYSFTPSHVQSDRVFVDICKNVFIFLSKLYQKYHQKKISYSDPTLSNLFVDKKTDTCTQFEYTQETFESTTSKQPEINFKDFEKTEVYARIKRLNEKVKNRVHKKQVIIPVRQTRATKLFFEKRESKYTQNPVDRKTSRGTILQSKPNRVTSNVPKPIITEREATIDITESKVTAKKDSKPRESVVQKQPERLTKSIENNPAQPKKQTDTGITQQDKKAPPKFESKLRRPTEITNSGRDFVKKPISNTLAPSFTKPQRVTIQPPTTQPIFEEEKIVEGPLQPWLNKKALKEPKKGSKRLAEDDLPEPADNLGSTDPLDKSAMQPPVQTIELKSLQSRQTYNSNPDDDDGVSDDSYSNQVEGKLYEEIRHIYKEVLKQTLNAPVDEGIYQDEIDDSFKHKKPELDSIRESDSDLSESEVEVPSNNSFKPVIVQQPEGKLENVDPNSKPTGGNDNMPSFLNRKKANSRPKGGLKAEDVNLPEEDPSEKLDSQIISGDEKKEMPKNNNPIPKRQNENEINQTTVGDAVIEQPLTIVHPNNNEPLVDKEFPVITQNTVKQKPQKDNEEADFYVEEDPGDGLSSDEYKRRNAQLNDPKRSILERKVGESEEIPKANSNKIESMSPELPEEEEEEDEFFSKSEKSPIEHKNLKPNEEPRAEDVEKENDAAEEEDSDEGVELTIGGKNIKVTFENEDSQEFASNPDVIAKRKRRFAKFKELMEEDFDDLFGNNKHILTPKYREDLKETINKMMNDGLFETDIFETIYRYPQDAEFPSSQAKLSSDDRANKEKTNELTRACHMRKKIFLERLLERINKHKDAAPHFRLRINSNLSIESNSPYHLQFFVLATIGARGVKSYDVEYNVLQKKIYRVPVENQGPLKRKVTYKSCFQFVYNERETYLTVSDLTDPKELRPEVKAYHAALIKPHVQKYIDDYDKLITGCNIKGVTFNTKKFQNI